MRLLYLSEADFSIVVLIYSLDHFLQCQVCLGLTKLLHHQLQLREVDEIAFVHIIPVQARWSQMLLDSTHLESQEFGFRSVCFC